MEQKHEVCWGKILKGAAIAAGVVLVGLAFLPAAPTIAAWSAAHAGAGIGAWIATHAASAATWMLGHELATLTGAALIGGAAADLLEVHDERKQAKIEQKIIHADERSFAMREDIRKMQALMVARMQAQGYQPAMAMATQQR